MDYRRRRLLLLKKKLLLLKKKSMMKKRLWVHPLNKERNTKDLFTTFVPVLCLDKAADRHHHHLRMSRKCFDNILTLVASKLTKKDTNMREAIKPELKLAVTIQRLAEGSSYRAIAAHYRLGRSTVSQIILDTCQALTEALEPIYLKPPSEPTEWKNIAKV